MKNSEFRSQNSGAEQEKSAFGQNQQRGGFKRATDSVASTFLYKMLLVACFAVGVHNLKSKI
ncbi:hypothetical protein FACHB389_21415 [Nostoc calcicola FACHB-389]|nr:hypothetical protein FACHB389_21415 [Nostoc calcicola FACHB-389]